MGARQGSNMTLSFSLCCRLFLGLACCHASKIENWVGPRQDSNLTLSLLPALSADFRIGMLPCLEDRELDRAETRFKSDPFLFSMLSVDFRIGMLPQSITFTLDDMENLWKTYGKHMKNGIVDCKK